MSLTFSASCAFLFGFQQQSQITTTAKTGQWNPIPAAAEARTGACAAALRDGRILIAGGTGAKGVLNSAELFDLSAGFSNAAQMSTARYMPTCVVLQDGRVLVAGGSDAIGPMSTAEIYDPVADHWTKAGEMAYSRSGHTATRLTDGRVLIAGGEGQGAVRNTLEMFDPFSNSFTLAATALSFPRKEHAAAALPDGRVMIMGGSSGPAALDTTEIYDPVKGALLAGPPLSSPRAGLSATVLMDGNILIAGGSDGSNDLATAETFDVSAGKFVEAGKMTAPRRGQLAFLLPNNNQVLLIGGDQANRSAELFTPWRNAFAPTGSGYEARKASTGAALDTEGLVLLSGGSSSSLYRFPTLRTSEEDYALTVTGSGWQPGEPVTLLTQQQPKTREDLTRTVHADAAGSFSDTQPLAQTQGRFSITATSLLAAAQSGGSTGANLDQCADGPNLTQSGQATATCTWVNGNVNGSKATYFEGDSLPYKLVITNLPLGTHTVSIEWDTTQSGKHALDYITSFDRTIQKADPCAGITGCGSPTLLPIPADPHLVSAGPGGANVPQISGNFSIWGVDSSLAKFPTAGAYFFSGSYASSSSTGIMITFTATQSTVVLAWGGHIATRLDWGAANSAVAISGSPYHTRLLALDNNGGNQDRALSSDATIFPGSITVIKSASPQGSTNFSFNVTSGGLTPSPFVLTDDGTSANTRTFSNITTFTQYAISETPLDGWTDSLAANCTVTSPNGGSSSSSGTSYTINLKEGENYACTFTNTAKAAHLKLVKSLSAGDDGTFDLKVGGTTITGSGGVKNGGFGTTDVTVPNTVTISEAAHSGDLANYTSSVSCDKGSLTANASGQSGSLVIPVTLADQNITCTFTNTRKTLTLVVKKALSPKDDGGVFDLKIDGSVVTGASGVSDGGSGQTTVNVGASASVAETGHGTTTVLANYSSTLACDNSALSLTTATSGSFTVPNVTGPVTCTFTNTRKTVTLIVQKVLSPASDGGLFDLKINGVVVTGAAGVGNNGTGQTSVNVGVSASVAEAGHGTTSLANYTSTLVCDNDALSRITGTSGTFTVPNVAGPVTCTFTNSNQTATLTVVKVCAASTIDPATGTASFTVGISPSTPAISFNLGCGVSHDTTLIGGDGTSYTVSETAVGDGFTLPGAGGVIGTTGWTAPGSYNCDNTASNSVSLKSGDHKYCFILNVANYCVPPFPPAAGSSSPQAVPASRPRLKQAPVRRK